MAMGLGRFGFPVIARNGLSRSIRESNLYAMQINWKDHVQNEHGNRALAVGIQHVIKILLRVTFFGNHPSHFLF